MSTQTAAILPDLATYQQYLAVVESATGKHPWQPESGLTNGVDFALILPVGQESLVPGSYPQTISFLDYSFDLQDPPDDT